jgi:Flp pilus assembly pilin Flp
LKLNPTNLKPTQRGQGMMEYIIIVAMIAVSAIAVYAAFGKTIRTQTANMALELSGQAADTNAANEAANLTLNNANKDKGMGKYGNDNDLGN